jgi:hypothetical protein
MHTFPINVAHFLLLGLLRKYIYFVYLPTGFDQDLNLDDLSYFKFFLKQNTSNCDFVEKNYFHNNDSL